MIVHACVQRSPEWRALRVGRLTGSAVPDMLATIKKGEAAPRRDLRLRLALERLTGVAQEPGYQSADMTRGIDLEAEARRAYEAETGSMVREVGFLTHDTIQAGASPDGIIGAFEGSLEIKVPKSATHLAYLSAGVLPEEYRGQVRHLLWLTGAAWCDFVSYNPRFPEGLQLFIVRVWRNDPELHAYQMLVHLFLQEVDAEVDRIKALGVRAA